MVHEKRPTMTFDEWTAQSPKGPTAAVVTWAGRPHVEVRLRSGNSLRIPMADAVDAAHAIDRAVTAYVEKERRGG